MSTNAMGRPESLASSDRHEVWKKHRTTITEFLQRVRIPVEVLCSPSREAVEKLVLDHTKGWENMGFTSDRWRPFLKAGIDLGAVGYGHTRVDVQAHIALFTVLFFCIDEFVASAEALDGFSARLLSGTPQLDPLLDCMVDSLRHMPDFFLPYAAKCIVLSAIEFIDSCLHDKDVEGMKLHTAALPYINFKRMRNGLAAVYAFFVWDKFSFPNVSTYIQVIPEAMIYICHCNDILSFYKEQLAGEKDNYVNNRALVANKDVDAVLSDIIDEAMRSVDVVRSVLQGEEKTAWEMFLRGYTASHYMTSRYRLAELLDGESVLF
ncbi:isoprenoid synthase domain-containing protein [Irpex rosettiformis]|uniref:Isoprenoid synthase domain-containing protein n=1 Tax=Irpex rosettiformis TaxID=378272 RepID=A0ACB8U843_9APHY|nr:isoprenoid synthase domain-containing protein [Irpex rosettiformis]